MKPLPKIKAIVLFVVLLAVGGCATLSLSTAMMSPETKQAEALRRVDRAVEAFNNGNAGLANQLLTEATQLMELIGGGRGEIAQRLIEQGRPETAAAWLEPLTREKEASQDPLVWGMLAKAAEKAGTPRADAEKRALSLAEAALQTVGQNVGDPQERARRFLRVGLFFLEQGDRSAEAIRAFREAVRLARRPETLNALGYTLADQGQKPDDFEEAVQMTRAAVTLAPENGVILDSFGWALFKRDKGPDDLAGARRVLREAIELTPEVPEIRYHLAMVYGRLGLTRDAALELDRALRLRPGFPEARKARNLLKIRWGV